MDRKQAILDSAEMLARSRGYDGFSYADIEKEVGIRKASIHHHFPSKSDLALALARRYHARFVETLNGIARKEGTAAGRLLAYLDAYRNVLSGGDAVCLCVAFSAGRDSLSPAALKEVNGFHDDSIAWLEDVFRLGAQDGSIRDGAAPKTEATACLALVEGAQLIARAAQDTARFEAAVAGLRARAR